MADEKNINPMSNNPNPAPGSVPPAQAVNSTPPQPVVAPPAQTRPASTPATPTIGQAKTTSIPISQGIKPKTQPQAPKQIAKEKKTPSKGRFLFGCAGGFIFLFILFIILMVLAISRTGASNPVMQAFGLDPSGIRSFLQGVVGFSFGMLAILFLVLAVLGLFRFLGTQKSDKEKRRRSGVMTFISSGSLVLIIFIWVFLATYIGRIQIASEVVLAEIVVLEPTSLDNLVAPVEIRFSALNVAKALEQRGVQLTSMNWDLDGDGVFETPVGANPEITRLYNQRGNYNVGLQVRVAGEEEFREPYTKLISIQDALFQATPTSGTAPLIVQFDASNLIDGRDVASIDWDFDGDGQFDAEFSDNVSPRFTFQKIGTYNILLRVLDENNNVENYRRTLEVTPTDQPLVSARIQATPGLIGAAPFQVRFDAGQSSSLKGNVTGYEWDFGDGSPLQSGRSVSHTYSAAGLFTVTLTAKDSLGNEGEITAQVEAQSSATAPIAVISTDLTKDPEMDALMGELPLKIMFDASKSEDKDNDIVAYEWDFDGDGEVDQEGEKVEHTFEQPGTFPVTLRLEDSEKQSGSASINVIVAEPGVKALIQAIPEEGTAPLTVQFDGSSSSTFEGNIVSYEWDFGDGSPKTITSASVSHKYNVVGTYEVRLRVLTNNNQSAATTKLVYVREIPLKACYDPSRSNGAAPLTVSFDSKCSTGNIAFYKWQYGDGVESTSASPTHTFETPGAYTVILEVMDGKNNVNTYQQIIVAEGEL